VIARVIGLGNPAAGDDGVGLAVIDRLRALLPAARPGLIAIAEASALIPWCEDADRVLLVDALVDDGDDPGGGGGGAVRFLDEDELVRAGSAAISTHGIPVADAIGIARALGIAARIDLLGIAVRAAAPSGGLSAEAAAAVEVAAAAAASWLQDA
jgi:hydrogenase maturation protease